MLPIRLSSLTHRFGDTLVLDAIDLEIHAGEIFCLLGPSGCGKTTLMRIIAGLLSPTGGSVHFGPREVTHLPTAQRHTALVFQSYALWPHMTVAQNVAFGLDVRQIPRDEKLNRVAEALATVRLEGLEGRRPAQLSGGQQQRVALARALVVRPDVLLLDEPLSNLDARLRAEMRGELRRICKETHATTIHVTHDQEEALSLADRIALMRDGRVVQVGPPREVYTRPETRFAAEFLGKGNFFPATITGREGDDLLLTSPLGPLRKRGQESFSSSHEVTACLRPESIRIEPLLSETSVPNSTPARHVEATYLGHLAEHLFQTPSGQSLVVHELKPGPSTPRESVRLTFDPADLILLPCDEPRPT